MELLQGNLPGEEHSSRQQEEMLQSGWGIFRVTGWDFEKCEGQKKENTVGKHMAISPHHF